MRNGRSVSVLPGRLELQAAGFAAAIAAGSITAAAVSSVARFCETVGSMEPAAARHEPGPVQSKQWNGLELNNNDSGDLISAP